MTRCASPKEIGLGKNADDGAGPCARATVVVVVPRLIVRLGGGAGLSAQAARTPENGRVKQAGPLGDTSQRFCAGTLAVYSRIDWRALVASPGIAISSSTR